MRRHTSYIITAAGYIAGHRGLMPHTPQPGNHSASTLTCPQASIHVLMADAADSVADTLGLVLLGLALSSMCVQIIMSLLRRHSLYYTDYLASLSYRRTSTTIVTDRIRCGSSFT
jgi:hypothetical protein